jgi:hypothetical protein
MRKLLVAFALLLAGSGVVWADGIPTVVDAQAGSGRNVWTMTVFNDSGGTVQSGEIVVWDTTDADLSDGGLPYVTISETDSDASTAGVIIQTCPNQSQCDMAILGITKVRCMDAGDAVTAGDLVSNSSIDGGKCGDHSAAADNRAIGIALEAGAGTDYEYIDVFLYPADGQ